MNMRVENEMILLAKPTAVTDWDWKTGGGRRNWNNIEILTILKLVVEVTLTKSPTLYVLPNII